MDRVTRIRIENVRAIVSADIEVSCPFTVLIGENGAGKSTVIECLALLRRAGQRGFMQDFYRLHGGMPSLLRKGATHLALGLVIEDDAGALPPIEYSIGLALQGSVARIDHERVVQGGGADGPAPTVMLLRDSGIAEIYDAETGAPTRTLEPGAFGPELMVAAIEDVNSTPKATDRVLNALRGIEVHLGFDSLASWAARSLQRVESLRTGALHAPAERVGLLGTNLANAWSELRGRATAEWERTLDLARLGLGERLDSVVVTPDAGGGHIHLALRFTDLPEPIYAANLSDGQLSWLAFVAMARLSTGRSLLAIDEPERHLHPALLGRVIALLEGLDDGAPVLLSTHSDRVLELLDDPAAAVRVCSLEQGKAVIARIDPAVLPQWLEEFGDFGRLRAAGYLSSVVKSPSAAPVADSGRTK